MRRLLLAACATALLTTGAAAQTLNIALREDPDILDPTLSRTFVGRIVFAVLCDKLFDINQKLEPVPMLATGYKYVTPTELVINLRPDVLFQDGTKMDAEAVKYSLERNLTMKGSYRRSEINAIDHIDVVDPVTVKITLKQPSSPFLSQLLDRSGMIVSPKAAEAAGENFGLHPVCAGPFSFAERVAQDHITLKKFPQYWNKDAIKLDEVTYRIVPNSSIRLANLEAGSVDLVEFIAPTDIPAVKRNPKLRMETSDYLGYQTLQFNVGNGPRAKTPIGEDKRVRQAFEAAIDREALVQVVFNGAFTPTTQAAPSKSPFHIDALKPQPRDLAKAKALLKEAGVKTPVEVSLLVPNNPELRQVGEIIQAMTAEAGFDVKLTATEFASGLAATTRGDFEVFLIAWSGRVDPDGNLYSFLHTGAPLNEGKYSNPEVDALLEKAREVSDVPQRKEIYGKMYQIVLRDLPRIYLWQQSVLNGVSDKVQGYEAYPDGMIRLQGVSLAK